MSVSTVDIYPGLMCGAIGVVCETLFSTENIYIVSLCTAYVYLSLSAKVLTLEAVAEAKYMLRS